MSIGEKIIIEIGKAVISVLKDSFQSLLKSDGNQLDDINQRLYSHLKKVENWSRRVQILDIGDYHNTDTVMLQFQTITRRYRSEKGKSVSEDIFLNNNKHYFVYGDPGSGKTTTLKRLARRLFQTTPKSQNDFYQYPVLLILRDYESDFDLMPIIAEAIGVEYRVKHENDPISNRVKKVHYMVGSDYLQDLIPNFLDSTGAVLLIDGLDEVENNVREKLALQINNLSRSLNRAKVVLTSRFGASEIELEGFKSLEIIGLDIKQVREIASIWLENPDQFLNSLRDVPYRDLVNRPLLLIQLLCLFKYEGELPSRPSLIYKKIIRLLLLKWDRARGIVRKSKYSHFDPDTKEEFLGLIAYELTYRMKTAIFSDEVLRKVYIKICPRFELPAEEATDVAREIETHTGIIQAASGQNFEFSHLSLQEYLCASHIVLEPSSGGQIGNYVREKPSPLAVAVALSRESASYLAELLLKYGNHHYFNASSLRIFFERLLIEKPYFKETTSLGYAVISLYFNYCDNISQIHEILADFRKKIPTVDKSLGISMAGYRVYRDKSEPGKWFYLVKYDGVADLTLGNEYSFPRPGEGRFPWNVFMEIIRQHNVKMWWSTMEAPDPKVWKLMEIRDNEPVYT